MVAVGTAFRLLTLLTRVRLQIVILFSVSGFGQSHLAAGSPVLIHLGVTWVRNKTPPACTLTGLVPGAD